MIPKITVLNVRGFPDQIQQIEQNNRSVIEVGDYRIVYEDNTENLTTYESDSVSVLIMGNIHRTKILKDTDINAAEYIHNKYGGGKGIKIDQMSGTFACVIANKNSGQVYIGTDRLSSIPVYYTTNDEEIYSTDINILTKFANPKLSKKGATQYLRTRKSLGKQTVFENIHCVNPGHIIEIGNGGVIQEDKYWEVSHSPKTNSMKEYVEKFDSCTENVLRNILEQHSRVGILISGGSDSRYILEVIHQIDPDCEIICYHMNDWMCYEAQISEQVVNKYPYKFRYLHRTKLHHQSVLGTLEENMPANGYFHSAKVYGFKEDIQKDNVDAMISGEFYDTLFTTMGLPTNIKKYRRPKLRKINNVREYIRCMEEGYLGNYNENIYENERYDLCDVISYSDKTVELEGVRYGSLNNLIRYGNFYPLKHASASTMNLETSQYVCPTYFPFLDYSYHSLLENIPKDYLLKYDILNMAMEGRNEEISSIPTSKGIPPSSMTVYPNQINLERLLNYLVNRFPVTLSQRPYADHLTQGSWATRQAAVKEFGNYIERIDDDELSEFVDVEKIKRGKLKNAKKNGTESIYGIISLYALLN